MAASGLDVAPWRSRSRPPRTVPRSRAVATNAAAAASSNGTRHPRASASASPMTGATANPIPNAATGTALPQARATPVAGAPSAAEAGSGSPRGSPAATPRPTAIEPGRPASVRPTPKPVISRPTTITHIAGARPQMSDPAASRAPPMVSRSTAPRRRRLTVPAAAAPTTDAPRQPSTSRAYRPGSPRSGMTWGETVPTRVSCSPARPASRTGGSHAAAVAIGAGDTSCGRPSRSGVDACIDQVSPRAGDPAVGHCVGNGPRPGGQKPLPGVTTACPIADSQTGIPAAMGYRGLSPRRRSRSSWGARVMARVPGGVGESVRQETLRRPDARSRLPPDIDDPQSARRRRHGGLFTEALHARPPRRCRRPADVLEPRVAVRRGPAAPRPWPSPAP